MNFLERYEFWCKNVSDADTLQELSEMKNDLKKIENSFYKDLEFGTAGLRGVMGAGTNCLNIYTIIKTTQGIADSMESNGQTVACVTFDSRLNSQLFAETSARVFAKNGIKCFLTEECQPTPFLSFAVRTLKCDIGVNITASHNPKEYNGYKVYDSNGCQLTDYAASEITKFIDKVNPFDIKLNALSDYVDNGCVVFTAKDLEDAYINRVLQENLNCADGIKVAFTPLNGAGHKLVPQILRNIGVKDVFIVEEQRSPDGNFSTCAYPNPEKAQTLSLALELAKEKKCDLVIATDPDCDRLGLAVLHNNEYKILSGNETGILLLYYILKSLSERKSLKKGSIVVKTVVSSALTEKVASLFDVTVVDVLTGFKYIGDVIAKLEKEGKADLFVFGFEESCGYLKGSYVRDKDAVLGSMLAAEMTATFKKQGLTLVDVISQIYSEFGTYEHNTVSYSFSGAEGEARKLLILSKIRQSGFSKIGGQQVVEVIDYLDSSKTSLPRSDMLKFVTENGTILIVRPSGTEPLVKNYITVCGTEKDNKSLFKKIFEELDDLYK